VDGCLAALVSMMNELDEKHWEEREISPFSLRRRQAEGARADVLASGDVRPDDELLAAWAGGDASAGKLLIERHYDSVARFFRTKARTAWEDLVQRTFLVLAEQRGKFEGQASVRAFLFGIARNVLFEHIRQSSRAGRADPDFRESAIVDLSPGIGSMAVQRADQRLLVTALQHIPLELQVLLELYYWEELDVAELAQVLQIPAGTVKSRLSRGRALLREQMERLPATAQERESVRVLFGAWIERINEVER